MTAVPLGVAMVSNTVNCNYFSVVSACFGESETAAGSGLTKKILLFQVKGRDLLFDVAGQRKKGQRIL